MNPKRRLLFAVLPGLVAGSTFNVAGCAFATNEASSWASGGVAAIEIIDRATGEHLPAYTRGGERYVVGVPGHEYQLRIRNLSGARILAVGSVDGVNIVSGETASPTQSGYVLAPWSTLDVNGWRTSLSATAGFYFTQHDSSYAARTGRPDDVGVIGVAVFRERVKTVDLLSRRWSFSEPATPPSSAAGEPRERDAAKDNARLQQAPSALNEAQGRVDSAPAPEAKMARKSEPSLGTGYGRDETSYVTRTAFERATSSPAEVLSVRYDSRANLIAMGVLPQPRIIGRAPDPFPGSFVAPPSN